MSCWNYLFLEPFSLHSIFVVWYLDLPPTFQSNFNSLSSSPLYLGHVGLIPFSVCVICLSSKLCPVDFFLQEVLVGNSSSKLTGDVAWHICLELLIQNWVHELHTIVHLLDFTVHPVITTMPPEALCLSKKLLYLALFYVLPLLPVVGIDPILKIKNCSSTPFNSNKDGGIFNVARTKI